MMKRAPIAMVLGLIAFSASAQLYRWTDEQDRVHVTDTPPPASAKNVQKKAAPAESAASQPPVPYELGQAMKDFPVTLYSSPNCKAPCAHAREALNKRGVPFKEVQVWDEDTNAELRRVSGGSEVPTLVVGRSVHRGFEQSGYDALLDSARYPKAGVLPERAQAAPPPPPGYAAPGERPAEPVEAEPERPRGPYAPKPPPPAKK
ncbi:MAG: glutaredoxin family protein [Betaproteobacteria bacterium]|nr:MAG: glutaredoxin family protein [Betaproteobacteria bacterium]